MSVRARQLGKAHFRSTFLALIAASAIAAGVDVRAQGTGHGQSQAPAPAAEGPKPTQEEKWRSRFPQPVLVSDLIGRQVLNGTQGVLGRIETLVRGPDGEVQIVFTRRRFLLFHGPTVAVPANVAALLGQFVMVVDMSEDDVDKLPAFAGSNWPSVERNSRIRMALTKN